MKPGNSSKFKPSTEFSFQLPPNWIALKINKKMIFANFRDKIISSHPLFELSNISQFLAFYQYDFSKEKLMSTIEEILYRCKTQKFVDREKKRHKIEEETKYENGEVEEKEEEEEEEIYSFKSKFSPIQLKNSSASSSCFVDLETDVEMKISNKFATSRIEKSIDDDNLDEVVITGEIPQIIDFDQLSIDDPTLVENYLNVQSTVPTLSIYELRQELHQKNYKKIFPSQVLDNYQRCHKGANISTKYEELFKQGRVYYRCEITSADLHDTFIGEGETLGKAREYSAQCVLRRIYPNIKKWIDLLTLLS